MCAVGENMYFVFVFRKTCTLGGAQVSLSLGGAQSLENAAFFK